MKTKLALGLVALLYAAVVVSPRAFADSYTINVYDSGASTYNDTPQPAVGLSADDSGSGLAKALVFTLPFAAVPGDYSFDKGLGLAGFFTTESGISELILYEDPSVDGSLAGTGLPTNISNTVVDIGGLNLPVLGELTPDSGAPGSSSGNTVSYTFTDVASSPEPGMVAGLLSLGGMGLIGLVWRRRK